MKVYLIRHAATKGNLERRYVGSTDECLLSSEREELDLCIGSGKMMLPEIETLYVSPMKRCRETAGLLYPGREQVVIEAFRECCFGEFEYKNYEELGGNPAYQRFLDTLGKSGFPGGEDRDTFQERCVSGFEKMMAQRTEKPGDIALVVHGGTIMALLDYFSRPHRDYYDWQVKNGEGFAAQAQKRDGSWILTGIEAIRRRKDV